MTIRGNKAHHNGQGIYGGGIDVRHADGTIANNLVYKNNRGGVLRQPTWAHTAESMVSIGKERTRNSIVYPLPAVAESDFANIRVNGLYHPGYEF